MPEVRFGARACSGPEPDTLSGSCGTWNRGFVCVANNYRQKKAANSTELSPPLFSGLLELGALTPRRVIDAWRWRHTRVSNCLYERTSSACSCKWKIWRFEQDLQGLEVVPNARSFWIPIKLLRVLNHNLSIHFWIIMSHGQRQKVRANQPETPSE